MSEHLVILESIEQDVLSMLTDSYFEGVKQKKKDIWTSPKILWAKRNNIKVNFRLTQVDDRTYTIIYFAKLPEKLYTEYLLRF